MLAAFAYLLVVGLSFGFASWKLLGLKEEDPIAAIVMYLATGLVVFVQASLISGFLHIASWIAYLALAVVLLVLAAFRTPGGFSAFASSFSFKLPTINRAWFFVFIIFIAQFMVLWSGAFTYPWLEDDDPWEHAGAVTYIAKFNTFIQPDHLPLHYLAPYPPFFDMVLGPLYQVDPVSMSELLKGVNVLLVSLAIPFFYCWAKRRFGERTALWAAFVLAALPAFMSHFIWAQTLCMLLVFPSLYFIDRAIEDGKSLMRSGFAILALLATAAVLISQPSAAVMYLGVLGCYLLAYAVSGLSPLLPVAVLGSGSLVSGPASNLVSSTKNSFSFDIARLRLPLILVFGSLILALVEFWVPMFLMYPASAVLDKLSLSAAIITQTGADTGGGLVYSVTDLMIAPTSSKIDQATGFGIVASTLALIGVGMILWTLFGNRLAGSKLSTQNPKPASKSPIAQYVLPQEAGAIQPSMVSAQNTQSTTVEKPSYDRFTMLFSLLWFIYALVGTEGNLLPVKLVPHRFWVFLAIPVAILAGMGTVWVLEYFEKRSKANGATADDKTFVSIVAAVVLLGLIYTSAYPKMVVQTAMWPPGANFLNQEQVVGYVKMKDLPAGTLAFSLCSSDVFMMGMDKPGLPWVKEVTDYKLRSVNDTANGTYALLKKYNYTYMFMDVTCLKSFKPNEAQSKLNQISTDRRFALVESLSNNGFIVFRVN